LWLNTPEFERLPLILNTPEVDVRGPLLIVKLPNVTGLLPKLRVPAPDLNKENPVLITPPNVSVFELTVIPLAELKEVVPVPKFKS
jgi:hypothetical protein